MESVVIVLLFSFLGSVCLGITAVFLAKADVDSVYYGLIIRALASGPLVLIIALFTEGNDFLYTFIRFEYLFPTILASLALISADILIMSILKRKPVGIISPLISTFPLFTALLLAITGKVVFSLPIILFTLLIVLGVAFVTFDRSKNAEGIRVAPFDAEALKIGLLIALFIGITNYIDILLLQRESNLSGISYTGMKFMTVLLLSIIISITVKDVKWRSYFNNKSSTTYLLLGGFAAWGLGSVLIFSSYNITKSPEIVNAITGINPVFAVLLSLTLGMEKMNFLKIIGLVLCVVASIGISNL